MSAPAPELVTATAAGGLTVTATALSTVPLLQARLAIRLRLDTPADLAVSDVLAACLSLHPATARLEQVGGIASVSRRRDWLMLGLHAATEHQPLIAGTLAALVGAALSDGLVSRAVTLVTQQASLTASQPAVHATRRMWSQYFGHLPPALDPCPDPALTARITRQEVTAALHRFVTPRHAHLALVGDTRPHEAAARFSAALAHWKPAARHDDGPDPLRAPVPAPGITSSHRPGQDQTQIRLIAPGPPRTSVADFAAHQAAATVLGGSFSSRINTVLREQHGLAYRCRAGTDYAGRDFTVIEADVHTRHAGQAVRLLMDLTGKFAATGPTEEELRAARGFLTGAYTINTGSQSGRASLLTAALTQDLPPSALTDVPRALAALTAADVRAAAGRYRPALLSGVVCGDATDHPGQWR
ncbi:putative Zn-dependent peptidase [Streptomyces sp. BK208]|uniref:M16 family metallopeptidase n=1 Tax=Streptomyces sp. BK208 TaxID=2512150 RepID=UPI00105BBBD8|nr:insulinase family protein [Streptomyces sp. BK208]TDT23069.1 putative Zn-dependent peptidase [Streptomyces sp. BK208]